MTPISDLTTQSSFSYHYNLTESSTRWAIEGTDKPAVLGDHKNKTAEQKKAVMTAQTRMSVNIISLMPILFSLLLYFIDPATMNSMWDHPIGRMIFIT